MQEKKYQKVSAKTKLMLIKLTSIRPKIGPVNEIADLLGINYENAKTICRRYKNGSIALDKLISTQKSVKRTKY